MRENERTRHDRQRTGFKDQKRVNGRDRQPQYTHIAELIQDCQQFEREVKHFRSVTPEPRTMVYGIAASVPNTAAALRRTGRYS
ncbi:MAG: hypothetical protein HKK67_06925 [Chlorobiaceae bacterium]|nr:hypothetical protein [Chlorobiaceae bacterium]